MVWIGCVAVLALGCCSLAATLLYRKFRQKRTALALRIENDCGVLEQKFVTIGGIDQWISIRGEDRNNPALLLIHGGPGSSYSIFTPHLRKWEKYFTVVQWDQRGAGKTFRRAGPRGSGTITMQQLTSDGIEVAEYLLARLKKQRLFVLASSIGSLIGMDMVRRRPEIFHAYIGTDQNVGMGRKCNESHRIILDRLHTLGMTRGIEQLERIGADPRRWNSADFTAVAQWTMKSDPRGFRRTMRLLKDAVWYAPGWGIHDVRAFVRGMRFSLAQLLPDIARYDAWAQGTRFALPVFIFQGGEDVLTTPLMARELFEDIVAPAKRMELISGAGHFAAFQEPDKFLENLLAHVRPLAFRSGTEE